MTTLEQRVYICPQCDASFIGIRASTYSHAGSDADFFPQYMGTNPLPYFIKVCPSCDHANYETEFKQSEQTETQELAVEPDIPCWRKYELVAEYQRQQQASSLDIAQTLHHAAWCCRAVDFSDIERERSFLEQALTLFKQAITENTVPEKQRPIITYLIGELHRRLGDYDTALEWFEKVPALIDDTNMYAYLLRLLEIQIAKIRQLTNE